jgi:hypothetical protein
MAAMNRFVFLTEEGELTGPDAWNDPSRKKLWLYNLHYFDDLNAAGAADRVGWHRDLIQRWIDENPLPVCCLFGSEDISYSRMS